MGASEISCGGKGFLAGARDLRTNALNDMGPSAGVKGPWNKESNSSSDCRDISDIKRELGGKDS